MGKYRGVEVAALLSISDSLAEALGEDPWKPQFHLRRNLAGLERVFQVAVSAFDE